jgi:uncharacterized protein (DUF1697 family)
LETLLVLLRGINVGGNRRIAMSDLRDAFADMGFVDPVTYIQSGNVVVGSRRPKSARTASTIERRLSEAFGYEARVVVRDAGEVARIVRGIPKTWDPADSSMRYNVLFLTDRIRADDVVDAATLVAGLESLKVGGHVLYWSAPVRTLTRTTMVKLTSRPAYQEVTVRSLRTTLRLLDLVREHSTA